jgi:hypothetical protein
MHNLESLDLNDRFGCGIAASWLGKMGLLSTVKNQIPPFDILTGPKAR